ncbi:hypothetical protein ACQPWY_29825 [Pseudonocardia xinjiangensis]|uniref:hypothetical protein n=1 Tax=Pseudonocardia xinjiangensis TaxID=75289 RepID=UPI003D8E685B
MTGEDVPPTARSTRAAVRAAAPMVLAGVVSVALLLSVTAAVALSTGAAVRSPMRSVPIPTWPSTEPSTAAVPAMVLPTGGPEMPPALPDVAAGPGTQEPSVRPTPRTAQVPTRPARTPRPTARPRTTGEAPRAQPRRPATPRTGIGPQISAGDEPGPASEVSELPPRSSSRPPSRSSSRPPSRSATPSDEPDATSAEPDEEEPTTTTS